MDKQRLEEEAATVRRKLAEAREETARERKDKEDARAKVWSAPI